MEKYEDEEVEEYDEMTHSEIECSHPGCGFIACSLLEFEQHYAQHSFQCSQCGAAFDTAHRLDVHLDERHNPFFQVQVSRSSETAHFRCLHPTCELKFSNGRTRDEHARVIHQINGEASRRRRIEDNGISSVLSSAMNKLSVRHPDSDEIGWTGESQEGLATEKRRNVKKAVRRAKN